MNCYATLFAKWLVADNGHFEFLLENRLKPELGMEHGGLDYPPDKHKDVATVLQSNGLGAAVHLPFFGIVAGTSDKKLWRRSVDRLLKAVEYASWYGAEHLIGHPEFASSTDSLAAAGKKAAVGEDRANQPTEEWLTQSAKAWEEVLAATDARLYLENTDDQTPAAILSLLERLPRRAAMCLDVGHWYFAAHGWERRNLGEWLKPIAESGRLGHLHLHDNNGLADQHLGLGQGGIDYHEFFDVLKGYDLRPTFTLEAHKVAELKHSLAWLAGDSRGVNFTSGR